MGTKWTVWQEWERWSQHCGFARYHQIPSAFVQDDEYVLNDDDESEKEDEDKGYAENEKEFEILINSDSSIEIEWYSFTNRIKQPRRKTFSF